MIVLAALMVSYASSLRAYVEQHQQLAALRTEQQQRQQTVADLKDTIHRWRDPAYIEAQARTRFGWVMPGEVGYVVIDDNGNAVTSEASTQAKKGAGAPWWQQMWGSVGKADGVAPTVGSDEKGTPGTTGKDTPGKTGKDAHGKTGKGSGKVITDTEHDGS